MNDLSLLLGWHKGTYLVVYMPSVYKGHVSLINGLLYRVVSAMNWNLLRSGVFYQVVCVLVVCVKETCALRRRARYGDVRATETCALRRRARYGDVRATETCALRRRARYGDVRATETCLRYGDVSALRRRVAPTETCLSRRRVRYERYGMSSQLNVYSTVFKQFTSNFFIF